MSIKASTYPALPRTIALTAGEETFGRQGLAFAMAAILLAFLALGLLMTTPASKSEDDTAAKFAGPIMVGP